MRAFIAIPVLLLLCPAIASAADRFKCDGADGKRVILTEEAPGANCFKLPRMPDFSRWELVTVGESGALVFLDTQSITPDPGSITAWIQYFYDDKGQMINSRQIVRTLVRQEYNCKAMTVGTLSSAAYDWRGEAVSGGDTPFSGTSTIIPDTTTEAVWRRLCR